MKRFRVIFLLTVVFMVICSCNFPLFNPDVNKVIVNITDVVISPESGAGDFELSLAYKRVLTDPVTISCYYIAPDGVTLPIGNFTDSSRVKNKPLMQSMFFSIAAADGSVKPGTYTVTCQDDEEIISKSSSFVISGELTSSPSATPQDVFTEGLITYDEANESMTYHLDPFGFYPSQFHKWCYPYLYILPDSTISGSCSSSKDPSAMGLYGSWPGGSTIEGTVTGWLVIGGDVNFHEVLTEKFKPDDPNGWETRIVTIDGTGRFVSRDKATGTATFSAECRAAAAEASRCGLSSTYDSFTGSIPFEINFTDAQ